MKEKQQLLTQLRLLKEEAGSHSPSIFTIKEKMPSLDIKVDACFLSNPYATDLFLSYFKRELLDTGDLRDVLEFYPSQNQAIANNLSATVGVHPDNLFIGNGAIEIIQTIIQKFTKKKIIINIPTFSSYYEFVNDDTEIIYYKLSKDNDFQLDVEEYVKFVKKERPDTIVLINPNNPDGGYVDSENIRYILRELRDVKNIILDESFMHFAFESDAYDLKSAASLIYKFPNLMIIKSMSKDFGIAGIRAGYAIMNANRVKKLLLNGFLWNSNGLAEYFFRLYTRDEFLMEYEKLRIKYIQETQSFINEFKTIKNIKVYSSRANFALIEILDGQTSDDFVFNMLVDNGIYLRTCSDKIGLNGEFIRLASRTREENRIIIDAFKKTFN